MYKASINRVPNSMKHYKRILKLEKKMGGSKDALGLCTAFPVGGRWRFSYSFRNRTGGGEKDFDTYEEAEAEFQRLIKKYHPASDKKCVYLVDDIPPLFTYNPARRKLPNEEAQR